MVDRNLVDEAIRLADGADIHDIKALVTIYNALKEPNDVRNEIERELRSFVTSKRLSVFVDRSG